jgi:hypothetical protein
MSLDRCAAEAGATAAEIAASLRRDGRVGPVLVVVTDDLVGTLAPLWAEVFSQLGWQHRVRVLATRIDPREVDDLAEEAARFAPRLLLIAAPPEVAATLVRIAGLEAVPVVDWGEATRLPEQCDAPAD